MADASVLEGQDGVGIVRFPAADGSRVPYEVFSSQAIYDLEQERIYRGPVWSFLGLEAEVANPGDFKSTFVGDTPVVLVRTEDGGLAAFVNRCAHRGAIVCRAKRGNATSFSCIYHQWSYDQAGRLVGVPFRRGQKDAPGMPEGFELNDHNLKSLRVENYKGLVFATFSDTVEPLVDYIGPRMLAYVDRVFCKPVEYLGCTRQFSNSNWKLYFENVKDPYHASLLHLFHTTFNIFRVGMKAQCVTDEKHGLHSIILSLKEQVDTADAYKEQKIRSFNEGFQLGDPSILDLVPEYELLATNHIQPIFPQLVIQQIHNTLVARQVLPKGPNSFELIFHFFGYVDDTPELRALRLKQANLVGPAGYISMEDTEATELVQRGTIRDGRQTSFIDMGKSGPDRTDSLISESLIRSFWRGYAKVMGIKTGADA
jgi:anthranilate 1,2-dioxygenase large subunit